MKDCFATNLFEGKNEAMSFGLLQKSIAEQIGVLFGRNHSNGDTSNKSGMKSCWVAC